MLCWTTWVRLDHQLERVFVDARAGGVVHRYSDLRTEAAVGLGAGVWGDRKKVSADSAGGGFRAEDRLRPPALATYDLRYSLSAAGEALSTGRIDPASSLPTATTTGRTAPSWTPTSTPGGPTTTTSSATAAAASTTATSRCAA